VTFSTQPLPPAGRQGRDPASPRLSVGGPSNRKYCFINKLYRDAGVFSRLGEGGRRATRKGCYCNLSGGCGIFYLDSDRLIFHTELKLKRQQSFSRCCRGRKARSAKEKAAVWARLSELIWARPTRWSL
jgi:hypothetical protein